MGGAIRLFVLGVAGLGACGDGNGGRDAPGDPDGGGEAGLIRATVLTAEGVPDATARLVFQDRDGDVASDVAVDAMGRAEGRVPEGGSVTAVRIVSDATSVTATLQTTLGVKDGDDLTIGFKPPAIAPDRGPATTMTANFEPLDDALRYIFYTSCGASTVIGPPVTMVFRDTCHGEQFDLLAVASGSQLPVPHFLTVGKIPFVNGGAVDVRAPFKEMASFSVNLTNLPAEVSTLGITRSSMIGNAPVAAQSVVSGDPPAGALAVTVPYAPEVGTRSEIAISMDRAGADSRHAHEIHTAAVETGIAVDLAAQQLPWFGDVVQTATGGTWTMVAGGGSPDGMVTEWIATWNDGARDVTLTWRITQPAEMAGITLPKLPAAYAMIDPGQRTVTLEAMRVTMADYDNVAGYDELRQMAETLLLQPIGLMGAFVGVPFQRRVSTMSAF
jgi:hypothetical protein